MDLIDFPSFTRLARRINSALEAPKLVILKFPSGEIAEGWECHLRQALDESLRIQSNIEELIEVEIGANDTDVFSKISSALECEITNVQELLEAYDGEPPLVIKRPNNVEINNHWQSLLQNIASEFKKADSNRYYRMILLIDFGGNSFKEFQSTSPVVDTFQLWNPLSWEELRAYTKQQLTHESNEARRAWMISTYCGASNFDIGVLEHLIFHQPGSIEQTISSALEKLPKSIPGAQNQSKRLPTTFGHEWQPPLNLHERWGNGELIGSQIDRGLIQPWSAVSSDKREDLLHHYIWREQVTGLFALLIEIGREANDFVFSQFGSDWIDSSKLAIEPGEILSSFPEYKLGPIPPTLNKLLKGLRGARNRLAHLCPIEQSDLDSIWDLRLRVLKSNHN